MDALDLIENLKKTYASAQTYCDAGVTRASDGKTVPGQEPLQHFSTFFRRPSEYRCQCHYEQIDAGDEYYRHLLDSDGILWTDGKESKHYKRTSDTIEQFADPSGLFGPSLDPIFKGKAQVPDLVARLLMPGVFKDYDQFPLAKEYWTKAPAEYIGEKLCIPISQDLMVYKETLWIDKDDFVLRRHSRDIDYSFLEHPRVKSLIDTGSKMVRYFFKQFPDINKEILERGPRHYRTEFSEIKLNAPIEDSQLVFR